MRLRLKWRNLEKAAIICQSKWSRGLRRGSAAARLLRLWVRIPPSAWMSVCCQSCVLSGRGLYDGLITRPEESYWLSLRVIYKNFVNVEALTHWEAFAPNKKEGIEFSNVRRVLNVLCFLLDNSLASEFYMPTFLHTYPPMKMEQTVPKSQHIKFRRRWITQKKAYNRNIITWKKKNERLQLRKKKNDFPPWSR